MATPKESTKDMTIEQLARMSQKEFAAIGEKIDEVREELREEMKTGFAQTTSDLSETEGRLLNAIAGVEVKRREFDSLKGDVAELDARVGSLEKKR